MIRNIASMAAAPQTQLAAPLLTAPASCAVRSLCQLAPKAPAALLTSASLVEVRPVRSEVTLKTRFVVSSPFLQLASIAVLTVLNVVHLFSVLLVMFPRQLLSLLLVQS